MGIKVRNQDHYVLRLPMSGIATAANNKIAANVPFDGFLANINAVCASGGTGATNSIIDVNYMGTTIFSSATKVTIASTSGVVTYGTFTTDPLGVTAGATISVDVDSISTNLSGVMITVTISRQPPSFTGTFSNLDSIL
jgi:hypothetical protein